MIPAKRFVLDANVFIEASRRYYAFDLAPGFWQGLLRYAAMDRVVSIDRVRDELRRGNDDLAAWAERHESLFVTTDDPDVITAYGRIMNWVHGQHQFFASAKAKFAKDTDAWVVAYALGKDMIVVTHEQLHPDAKREVYIPNVCRAFSVSYMNTFEMLRKLGFQFR